DIHGIPRHKRPLLDTIGDLQEPHLDVVRHDRSYLQWRVMGCHRVCSEPIRPVEARRIYHTTRSIQIAASIPAMAPRAAAKASQSRQKGGCGAVIVQTQARTRWSAR